MKIKRKIVVSGLPGTYDTHELARIAKLETALQAALATIVVADSIGAVRAEYDFEPIKREIAAALRK